MKSNSVGGPGWGCLVQHVIRRCWLRITGSIGNMASTTRRQSRRLRTGGSGSEQSTGGKQGAA